jgi:cytochrome c oxidase subunit IV
MQVNADTLGSMPNVGFANGAPNSDRQNTVDGSLTVFRARVLCAYCSEPFTAEASHLGVHDMIYVRCLKCGCRSFLNSYYRFKRMLLWYTLAVLFIIAGVIVIGVMHADLSAGALVGCILPLLLGAACLTIAIYFSCLKVSEVM